MKHILSWVVLLLLSFAQLTSAVEANNAAKVEANDKEYIIGVDDQILVSVWRNPDLSITVPVRPDGKISTPLVGDVQAAGQTPEKLARVIKEKLSYYVKDPQVSIILTGLSSHEYLSRVRITGAVRSPQTLPYRKGMTVLDLVLAAGSTNEFASPNRAMLYRTDQNGQVKAIRIKLKNILKGGKLEGNLALQPGDVITVPESLF